MEISPTHSLRTHHGIKGTRQKVIATHNPSEINQNRLLLVRFLNLGSDDVIVPGTVNLSFKVVRNLKTLVVGRLSTAF